MVDWTSYAGGCSPTSLTGWEIVTGRGGGRGGEMDFLGGDDLDHSDLDLDLEPSLS